MIGGMGGEPKRGKLTILWSLTSYCNYRCSYCALPKITSPDESLLWDLGLIESMILEMKVVRGKIHVGFTGGEPTTHPQATDILRISSSASDTISIITNLSAGSRFFIENIPYPSKMLISASYQCESVRWDVFADDVKALSDAGFWISCTYVDYPPLREALSENLPRIRDVIGPDVPFLRHRYWDGTRFPEEDVSGDPAPVIPKIERESQPRDIPNDMWGGNRRLCRAGMDYILIMHDGKIYRCPSLVPLFGDVWPKIRIADEPLSCESLCLCTDMHDMWVTDHGASPVASRRQLLRSCRQRRQPSSQYVQ